MAYTGQVSARVIVESKPQDCNWTGEVESWRFRIQTFGTGENEGDNLFELCLPFIFGSLSVGYPQIEP